MWCVDWASGLFAGVPVLELVSADFASEALLGVFVVIAGLVAWLVFRVFQARKAAKKAYTDSV
jgi:hypothetical protein